MAKSQQQKDDEAALVDSMKSVSKSFYANLVGIDIKTVGAHSAKCGLGIDTEFVNVVEVLRAFHRNCKGKQSSRPSRAALRDDDESMLVGDGVDSPALERWREIRAEREALKLDTELGELVRRDEIKSLMETSAGLIRRCGKTLADQFGQEAATILAHAIDSVIMHISRELGDNAELQDAVA